MVSIPINTMNYRYWYHYSNHSGIRNHQHIGLIVVYSKWIMVLDYGHHQVVGFQPSPSLVMFMIGLWWLIGIGLPTLWNLVSYLTTGCPRWGRQKFGAKWSNDLWLSLLFLKKSSVLEWIPWTHKDRHLELGIVPILADDSRPRCTTLSMFIQKKSKQFSIISRSNQTWLAGKFTIIFPAINLH